MKTTDPVDAARIELLLTELRLPAAKAMWAKLAAQSDREGWPAARFLAVLAEHEMATPVGLPFALCVGRKARALCGWSLDEAH